MIRRGGDRRLLMLTPRDPNDTTQHRFRHFGLQDLIDREDPEDSVIQVRPNCGKYRFDCGY
jgi:hypothetical protein